VHRIGRTGRAGASGLAVSLVTGSDARLMADIEKLIKKKIDIEPFELEGSRNDRGADRGDRGGERSERGSFRSRRSEESDDRPDSGAAPVAAREPREARPVRSAPRRSQPSDPFFDKPYEPDPSADPVWEDKTAEPAASSSGSTGASGLSRFIKPKRKVASLLGGTGTAKR